MSPLQQITIENEGRYYYYYYYNNKWKVIKEMFGKAWQKKAG